MGFHKFHEPAIDYNFSYWGLEYSLRQIIPQNDTTTGPPPSLRNCHVLWAIHTLAQIWYQNPISNEVAVALDVLVDDERHRQWKTVAWLYLRVSNSSAPYPVPNSDNAIATTTLNTTMTTSSSSHISISKYESTMLDSLTYGLPQPNERYIESGHIINQIDAWYLSIQSIARLARYTFNVRAANEWKYDDDRTQLSYIWKRNESMEARVAWIQLLTEAFSIPWFMLGTTWLPFREAAADFKDSPRSPLVYGTLSLRKYPNPQTS